jgi:large subunit ribosomal protein L9
MKVILLEDVSKLGHAGETKTVSEGYARNYLLPKKLAILATTGNLKRSEQDLNSKKGQEKRIQREFQRLAEAINHQSLVFTVSTGEGGKLFGSVTTADIEEALAKRGIIVDKRKIDLEEPIKMVGSYTVTVKIQPDVTATLALTVQAESAKVEIAPPASAKAESTQTSEELPAQ